MKFTSNGIGRKNGFKFEIHFSPWRDGEAVERPYYLWIDRPATENSARLCTYTKYSARFLTEDAAKAFCEVVAIGETSFEEIVAAERKALELRDAKYQAKAKEEVDSFFDKMAALGVNPAVVQDVVRAYLDLNLGYDEKASNYFNQRLKESQEKATSKPPKKMTLADYMNVDQKDIDVCLVDKDTGEHLLPAICYLDKEEQEDPEFSYSDWEKWVLSLPLSHTIDQNGCTLAVVNTEFNWDQTCFLIEQEEFESTEWRDIYNRSFWAGAEFQDRLAYLQEGKSFEHPFDGMCMDSLRPEEQMNLCEMLADNNNVFITTDPDNEKVFYAYSYRPHRLNNRLICEGGVDIKFTEPGKGLTSTLQGKVYWAQHVGNKAKAEALKQAEPMKKPEKEAQL